jgi:hypothetical protein
VGGLSVRLEAANENRSPGTKMVKSFAAFSKIKT